MWATAILRLSQEQKRKWFILLVTAFPTPPSIWMFLLWSRQKTKSAPQFRSQIQVTQPVKKWYSSILRLLRAFSKNLSVSWLLFQKQDFSFQVRPSLSVSPSRRKIWHPTMTLERLQNLLMSWKKEFIKSTPVPLYGISKKSIRWSFLKT